jgi:hypothetical protein
MWEGLNNSDFKPLEFEGLKNRAGLNSFVSTSHQWIENTYTSEADLLNIAHFGETAREWREANPDKDGNMCAHATLEQLLVLANLENLNAEFIHRELPHSDRIKRLNTIAIRQMHTLTARTAKQLKGGAE